MYNCYHEPKVHDHELYHSLNSANLFGLLPLGCIGIIFNACALICLYRPPKITSGVFVFLKAVLILDHCQLLATILYALLPQFCDSQYAPHHTFYGVCMLERRFLRETLPKIVMLINTVHVWTIAALSAHRYWKISRPVKSRMNDIPRRAKLILAVLFLAAVAFRLPVFLLELRVKLSPMLRITTDPDWTEVIGPYRMIYHSLLDPFFSNVVPFIWMALFSLMTLHEVLKSRDFSYKLIATEIGGRTACNACRIQFPLLPARRKSDVFRQKQEHRATISIILMILFYLAFHSLQLYTIFRKWHLILNDECPARIDYILTQVAVWLSLASATVNAFVFIAFTNKLRKYVRTLIRKTSRTLSNSSDPPLSPKTTATLVVHQNSDNIFNI
ncbi:unnamed protein product, partial [Mesorhabditis spiculigera]